GQPVCPYALPFALQPLPLPPPFPLPPLLPFPFPFPLPLPFAPPFPFPPPPLPARARPGERTKTAQATTSAMRMRLNPQVRGVAAIAAGRSAGRSAEPGECHLVRTSEPLRYQPQVELYSLSCVR